MMRFYFVIIASIIPIIYFVLRCHYIEHHSDDYTFKDRYNLALYACRVIRKRSFITTKFFGQENLPKDGGYIMYPNHQGKYDAVGIMLGHSDPCSIVIDDERSHTFVLNEFTQILKGKRLNKADIRGQIKIMQEIATEVASGQKYILFPEGGYEDVTSNEVKDFMAGAFKAATKARCPIVPVALIDSYKPFSINSLKRVTTQVHFLSPISYDEYKDMKTQEISDLVRDNIIKKINEVLA